MFIIIKNITVKNLIKKFNRGTHHSILILINCTI